jgi:predicted TIM-barrel fold metal-dependent hydrolase
MLFAEGQTDIGIMHVLPVYCYKDGLCSYEKALEAQTRWPGRSATYCGVDPMQGAAAMEEMERQVEELNPLGLKLYPNSWAATEVRGWLMDDPEVAFPFFERAEQLGLKAVAIHKAVPLGPLPLEHYRVDDIDRAAMAFPNLNFEIVHGGMAFLEETAWQLARFQNVYVNLEITTSLLARRPKAFHQAMASLMQYGGPFALDKICWGTGAMAYHPQPLLERFVRDFKFTEEEVYGGLPEIDDVARGKILAGNYARMTGLDVDARLEAIKGDEFDRMTEDGLKAPYSTTQAAGHVS